MDRLQVSSAVPADRAEVLSDLADSVLAADYVEQAQEDIIQTVMSFGCYPQPRRHYSNRIKFDLREFLFDGDRISRDEVEQFFELAITNYGEEFFDSRSAWARRVEEMLVEYFTADAKLVEERAQELAEQAEADAELWRDE